MYPINFFHDKSVQVKERDKKSDSRGFFLELLRLDNREEKFEQMSLAMSHRGVVRGLHMQKQTCQNVLILHGEINAFFLDARPSSVDFGRLRNFQLDANLALEISCSPGICFGYEALKENTKVLYLSSKMYNPLDEITISFKELNPQFRFKEDSHIRSKRDQNALPLAQISKELLNDFI